MPPTVTANTVDNNPVIVAHEVIIEGTPPKNDTMRGSETPTTPREPVIHMRELYEERAEDRSEKRLHHLRKGQFHELLKMRDAINKHDVISLGIDAVCLKLDRARNAEPQKGESYIQDATYFMVHLRKIQGDPALTSQDREDIYKAMQHYVVAVKEMKPEDGAEIAKSIARVSGESKNWYGATDANDYRSIASRAGVDPDLQEPYKRYALAKISRLEYAIDQAGKQKPIL